MSTSKSKPRRTLVDFVMAKKRAGCPVCALAPDVREQLKGATTRKIRRAEQIEWLAAEHGVKLTTAAFDAHHSGRHEQ